MTRRILSALLLTTLVGGASAVALASPAHAQAGCDPETDAVIVIDAGELDEDTRVLCAVDAVGGTGLDALTAAGVEYEETSAAAPLVCRIDGLPAPEDESCGASLDGEGYWAFLVAQEGGEWAYASTGLGDHEVAEGEYLALVYAPLSETGVPEVPLAADASTREEAAESHLAEDPADATDAEEEADGTRIGLVVAALALVLLLAVGFVVYRGRKER